MVCRLRLPKRLGCNIWKIILDYFGVPSHGAQDTLLKKSSSSTASVVDEGQAPPATFAFADDADSDIDSDLKGAVGLTGQRGVG